MQKPDFGIGKLLTTQWTRDRIDYLKHLAGLGLSAAEISREIYGHVGKQKGIAAQCNKHGIVLRGRPGRKHSAPRPISIDIAAVHMTAIVRLAARHKLDPPSVVHRLIDAMFEQGETFVDNLLDLSAND